MMPVSGSSLNKVRSFPGKRIGFIPSQGVEENEIHMSEIHLNRNCNTAHTGHSAHDKEKNVT